MPEALPNFISEYRFFQNRQRKYTRNRHSEKLAQDHPSIPCFEWDDEGKHYSGCLITTVSDDDIRFDFHFSRNGIRVTFQAVLNSYKRFLARENLDTDFIA